MAGAGAGTYLYGHISESETLKRNGTRGALAGLALFVIFGLVFELFIFGTFSAVLRWLVPIVLLVAGGLILYRGSSQPTRQPAGTTRPTPTTHATPAPPPPAEGAPVPRVEPGEGQKP
mgnify:CR=1 FL=1